ncbi:DUF2188 domain-containing protein [Listeria newyorkensis]|uniref:DUF2188 domain-containing protein n=1 Tax=Listeria newyorkensis TaxID=1497681 RepID=A0A841YRE9_9LIST|nr:DUF2188 domain-containing protein [Listeria newyorkensis]MBC1456241.1 DUF2188 domain-containing protein [Listeria newyorkensis]
MAGKDQHVTKNSDGTWNVKGAGNSKATSIHPTQKEAIDSARQIAKNQKSELFIHGSDNKFRARDSYGNDPKSSKG